MKVNVDTYLAARNALYGLVALAGLFSAASEAQVIGRTGVVSQCVGDACHDVRFVRTAGGCLEFTNSSRWPVQISVNTQWGGTGKTFAPGRTESFRQHGVCVTLNSLSGDWRANYRKPSSRAGVRWPTATTAPTEVAPVVALGNFCQTQIGRVHLGYPLELQQPCSVYDRSGNVFGGYVTR